MSGQRTSPRLQNQQQNTVKPPPKRATAKKAPGTPAAKKQRQEDITDTTFDEEDEEIQFNPGEGSSRMVLEQDGDSIRKLVSEQFAELVPQAIQAAVRETMKQSQSQTQTSTETEAQNVVTAITDDITQAGELGLPNEKVNDVGLPPDMHLTAEKRSKVVGDKYINFGKLLYKDNQNDKKLTVKLNATNAGNHSLSVDPNENAIKIKNIDQWDRAFTVYQFAKVKAHPHEALGLIRYGRTIKDMAWRGFGWLQYDENFRRLRELDPAAHPWGKIEPTLWSTWAIPRAISTSYGISQTIGRLSNQQNFNGSNLQSNYQPTYQHNNFQQPNYQHNNFQQGNRYHPYGNRRGNNKPSYDRSRFNSQSFGTGLHVGSPYGKFCFKFNGGTFCPKPPCSFEHRCSKCMQFGHGAAKCRGPK